MKTLMKKNSTIKLLAKRTVMVIGVQLEKKTKWDGMSISQNLYTVPCSADFFHN